MVSTTTNFSFNLPAVNSATDEDLWGGYLNTNWTNLDTYLQTASFRESVSKTTTYTVTASERNKAILCDASGGAFTVTLLAAATAGDGFVVGIVKTDSSSEAVTIDGNASETIAGSATFELSGEGDAAYLVCDGSNWHFLGNKTTPSAVSAASTTAAGIVELAIASEAQAGTSSSLALTPDSLGDLFTSGSKKLILPGNFMMQWGRYTGGSASPTITFGTAFAAAPVVVAVPDKNDSRMATVYSVSTASFGCSVYARSGGSQSDNFYWVAIGTTS